jgi:hypothetical protein
VPNRYWLWSETCKQLISEALLVRLIEDSGSGLQACNEIAKTPKSGGTAFRMSLMALKTMKDAGSIKATGSHGGRRYGQDGIQFKRNRGAVS